MITDQMVKRINNQDQEDQGGPNLGTNADYQIKQEVLWQLREKRNEKVHTRRTLLLFRTRLGPSEAFEQHCDNGRELCPQGPCCPMG